MGLIAAMVAGVARRRLTRLRALALDPWPAQERLLARLLEKGARTAFGREHGYGRVRGYEGFRDATPLRAYQDFEPWWRRAREGEKDVTWPGRVPFFGLSSGTTQGEKHLPLTRDTLRTNRGGGFDNLTPFLARHAGRLLGGHLVFLSASTSLTRAGHAWVGDNTGVMAARVPWPFRSRVSPPPA